MVADEFPAMEVLAKRLRTEGKVESRMTDQARMPKALQEFTAVIVYIHKELAPVAEHAFIDYAEAGGRLVLLHHSISSGKRVNKDWFRFLGIELPQGPVEQGGYKWTEDVTVQWLNEATHSFVMTNHVTYPEVLKGEPASGAVRAYPAFTLEGTEVYLNHRLSGPRAALMGLRYTDAAAGRTWVQHTAGWSRPAGKGIVFYFMPGHTARDFENLVYGRIIVNAITATKDQLPEP
jgi:hypothetical protein